MRKKKASRRVLSSRYRRIIFLGVVIGAASVVVGAAKSISRQSTAFNSESASATRDLSTSAGKKYVTVKVAGRDVQVDPQTGQIRPLTPEEAKQLADGLKVMLNRSTDGLVPVQHADGSVSMDLEGRFQNVAVAKTNADGSVTQSCLDNPEAAASFFGIDPQLLGVEFKNQPNAQPARVPPTKASRQ
jgi:hypothetical protein